MKSATLTALAINALLFGASCASSHAPDDATSAAPLMARDAQQSWRELLARRAELTGAQSYMRMRIPAGDHVQSLKARLAVDNAGHMQLDALTPIGTTAVVIHADGDRVTMINHLQRTWWKGSAAQLAKTTGIFAPAMRPSDFAMLLLGLPATTSQAQAATRLSCGATPCVVPVGDAIMTVPGLTYDVGPAGLRRVSVSGAGEVIVASFEPASYPPTTLIIERSGAAAGERVEIEHLELVMTAESVQPPEIPSDYTEAAEIPALPGE